jgi:ATP-dependent DNA ligase
MKPTFDAEFTITGWTVGEKGRARGALLFICEARDAEGHAQTFVVTPTGTVVARIEMARDFARIEENGRSVFDNNWRGKQLIVKFDELSSGGVPQRARTDSEIRELP